MKTITVFTPTYNRAHLLPRLYKSLCEQTNKDFIWLVIDDGSVDNTKELVSEWILKGEIEIEYHYKENGGMHTGHNLAYKLIKTELNVCIDSDDYMPPNAIQKIIYLWNSIEDKIRIAGIIGLDAEEDGKIIGTRIPDYLKQGSFYDLYQKYNVKGDKKIILRTDIIKKYPKYPEYEGEKLVPLGFLYWMIGSDFDFVYSQDVYCIVEYQEEGSSKTIIRQYEQSPKGFAYSRKIRLRYSKDIKSIIKNCIHLIAAGIIAKSIKIVFKDNPYKILTFILLPLGVLFMLYVKFKNL